MKKILCLLLAILLAVCAVSGCGMSSDKLIGALSEINDIIAETPPAQDTAPESTAAATLSKDGTQALPEDAPVSENGRYTSKDDVAMYIHLYGKLPGNFIKKSQAKILGWDASKNNLWRVADGMSIGGDVFGNYEGLLPKAEGRIWYECDIDYAGGARGAKRIAYSNDGLIFYTEDHYQSFSEIIFEAEK